MQTAQNGLNAKNAIEIAFSQFREFFEGTSYRNLLLEGVEFFDDDQEWVVSIGFDIGRQKKTGSKFALFEETTEPLREIRRIVLGAGGQFLRMA